MAKPEHKPDADTEDDHAPDAQYRHPSCRPGEAARRAFEGMEAQLPPEWLKPEW